MEILYIYICVDKKIDFFDTKGAFCHMITYILIFTCVFIFMKYELYVNLNFVLFDTLCFILKYDSLEKKMAQNYFCFAAQTFFGVKDFDPVFLKGGLSIRVCRSGRQ